MWRGSSVSASDEWIELYNYSDEIIDISGWTIFDGNKDEVMVEIAEARIAPKSFFLISNNEKDHLFSKGESVLKTDPDIVDSSVNLSNNSSKDSGLKLILKNKDGEDVDYAGDGPGSFYKNTLCSSDESITYGSKDCKDSDLHRSLQRIKYEDGTLSANWMSTKEADPNTIELETENIATPHNSGKPKILDFKISNNLFFSGQKNQYKIDFKIEDSSDDFIKLYLQVGRGGEISDIIEISSGEKINLNYNYCPKLTAISEDLTGLTDVFPVEINCVFLNDKIRINEVLPHPKDIDWNRDGKLGANDEWIELYNNSGQDTDLSGWKVKDKSGKEFLLDSHSIKGRSFILLYKNKTKIALNDDSEILFLVDPKGRIVSKVDIPRSSKYVDKSLSRFDSGWKWTKKATPLAVNILESFDDPAKSSSESSPSSEDSKLKKAQKIKKPKQKYSEKKEDTIFYKKTVTTIIRRAAPATLSSARVDPFVLGSRAVRNPPTSVFIRIEYLLYFFGFVAFFISSFIL
jgi:hypothetical protein